MLSEVHLQPLALGISNTAGCFALAGDCSSSSLMLGLNWLFKLVSGFPGKY